jgi:hypothetical protein
LKGVVQLFEGLIDEMQVGRIKLSRLVDVWFVNIQQQHGTLLCGLRKWRMVKQSQVTLEPYYLHQPASFQQFQNRAVPTDHLAGRRLTLSFCPSLNRPRIFNRYVER